MQQNLTEENHLWMYVHFKLSEYVGVLSQQKVENTENDVLNIPPYQTKMVKFIARKLKDIENGLVVDDETKQLFTEQKLISIFRKDKFQYLPLHFDAHNPNLFSQQPMMMLRLCLENMEFEFFQRYSFLHQLESTHISGEQLQQGLEFIRHTMRIPKPTLQQTLRFIRSALLLLLKIELNLSPPIETSIDELPFNYNYETYCLFLSKKLMELVTEEQHKERLKQLIETLECPSLGFLQYIAAYFDTRYNFYQGERVHLIFSFLFNLTKTPSCKIFAKLLDKTLQKGKLPRVEMIDSDINFLRHVCNHQLALKAIQQIDSCGEECLVGEEQTKQHIDSIFRVLSLKTFYLIDLPKVFGVTTYNGMIYLKAQFFQEYPENSPEYLINTVMRRITILHEMFGHYKRIAFTTQENTYLGTAEKKIANLRYIREAGDHIEYTLFGTKVTPIVLNKEIATEILNTQNWDTNYDFRRLFRASQLEQPTQIQITGKFSFDSPQKKQHRPKCVREMMVLWEEKQKFKDRFYK